MIIISLIQSIQLFWIFTNFLSYSNIFYSCDEYEAELWLYIFLLTRSHHQFGNFHEFSNQFCVVFFCYSCDKYDRAWLKSCLPNPTTNFEFSWILNKFYGFFVTAVMNMRIAWLLNFLTGFNHEFWKYEFRIFTLF